MEEKELINLKEYMNYLRNLKLVLVNGKMIKDKSSVSRTNVVTTIEKVETKKEEKDINEILNNVCNLKLEIKGSKVKKLG